MIETLKPCPFCKGKADVHWHDGFPSVVCQTCACNTGMNLNGSEAEAITAWNTRAEQSASPSGLAEPVGYVCAEHLSRRSEFERHGSIIYDRPLGTSTTPVYLTAPAPADAAEREVERLREALQPFADAASEVENRHTQPLPDIMGAPLGEVSLGQLRAARAALNRTEQEKSA